MRKILLLAVLFPFACGGESSPAASPTPSASASTSASSATSAPPVASASASASASAQPEFVATPADQLKKIAKKDLDAAVKLAKEGDAWDAAYAKVQKALGPQTFISRGDATSPGDAYYWSVVRKDGSCDQLLVMQTRSLDKVDTIKLKTPGAKESVLPTHGGAPINACTGLPRSKNE